MRSVESNSVPSSPSQSAAPFVFGLLGLVSIVGIWFVQANQFRATLGLSADLPAATEIRFWNPAVLLPRVILLGAILGVASGLARSISVSSTTRWRRWTLLGVGQAGLVVGAHRLTNASLISCLVSLNCVIVAAFILGTLKPHAKARIETKRHGQFKWYIVDWFGISYLLSVSLFGWKQLEFRQYESVELYLAMLFIVVILFATKAAEFYCYFWSPAAQAKLILAAMTVLLIAAVVSELFLRSMVIASVGNLPIYASGLGVSALLPAVIAIPLHYSVGMLAKQKIASDSEIQTAF